MELRSELKSLERFSFLLIFEHSSRIRSFIPQMPRIYFRGIWFFKYFSYICYDIKPLPKTMQAFKGTHGFYLVWELKAAALF